MLCAPVHLQNTNLLLHALGRGFFLALAYYPGGRGVTLHTTSGNPLLLPSLADPKHPLLVWWPGAPRLLRSAAIFEAFGGPPDVYTDKLSDFIDVAIRLILDPEKHLVQLGTRESCGVAYIAQEAVNQNTRE